MNDLIERFVRDGLTIVVRRRGASWTLTWEGTSDSREPDAVLAPLLQRLADQVVGGAVTVDFRDLTYMNSATVSPILQFIKGLDAHGVPTTLIYDTSIHWQRINFQCMRAIAGALTAVRVCRAQDLEPAAPAGPLN